MIHLSSDQPNLAPRTRARATNIRVAIAGLGTVGRYVARQLDAGMPGLSLSAVAVRDVENSRVFINTLQSTPEIVKIGELADYADIVVESAPSDLLADIAGPALRAGKRVIVLSIGALLDCPELVEIAREAGGQILVPTGALIGLDAVTAAAEGKITSVKMITRKPVTGLAGAPFLTERNLRIENITEPLRLFSGTAGDAIRGFPANLNVAVALSLAGIGADRTSLEIWADPALTRNTHRIEVESDSASFSMSIENIPTSNPKTGRITALSVVALLRKQTSPLRVGT